MGSLALALDSFSLDLYRQAGVQKKDENFTVSPVSIAYCTALTYAGARGSTKANLDKVFRLKELSAGASADLTEVFGNDLAKMNVKIVQRKITPPPLPPGMITMESSYVSSPQQGRETQLTLANAVFIQDSVELNQEYKNAVVQKLKASVEKKGFRTNPDAARQDINKWVDQCTNGKIKDLLPSNSISSDTIGVLVSAVYFKGKWAEEFEESGTQKKPFHQQNGSSKEVDIMHQTHKFSYTEDKKLDVQYLEMPYADWKASMLIILPREKNGLKDLEAALTPEAFRGLAGKVTSNTQIIVDLPKFKIEGNFDLKKLLESAGVTEIFADNADLTGIYNGGEKVVISKAFHKTFIDVDEKGTEAAAASAMEMICTSSFNRDPPPPPIYFTADHPFLFAIRHEETGLILFIGRVEKL